MNDRSRPKAAPESTTKTTGNSLTLVGDIRLNQCVVCAASDVDLSSHGRCRPCIQAASDAWITHIGRQPKPLPLLDSSWSFVKQTKAQSRNYGGDQ